MQSSHLNAHSKMRSIHRQNGAVLIVSLFLLIALTVLVLSSARSSRLEVDMGVNTQIKTEAFADAEGSVRSAEDKIEDEFDNGVIMLTLTENGFYNRSDQSLNWNNIDYNWSGLTTYKEYKPDNDGNDTTVITNEYMIEFRELLKKSLGGPNIDIHDRLIYRASGIGSSSNDTKRIVHTFYATLLQPPAPPTP